MRTSIAAVALVVLAACGGSSDNATAPTVTQGGTQAQAPPTAAFEKRPYEPVTDALRTAGITICDERTDGATIGGDYEHKTLRVRMTATCPSNDPRSRDFEIGSPGYVIIRSFNARATRDKAAGFGDSLIYWAWGDKSISVSESSRPEIIVAVEQAMKALGAQLVLDKR